MLPAVRRVRRSSAVLRLAAGYQLQGNPSSWPDSPSSCYSAADPAPHHCTALCALRCLRTSAAWQKSIQVEAPTMGESISEGTIAALLKQAGDAVEEDEAIAQIETDKVTIDVRAPEAGRLEEYRVAADDTIKVGQVVAVIAAGESASSSGGDEAESQEPQQPEKGAQQQQGKGEQSQQAKQQPDQPGQQEQLQQMYSSDKAHSEGRVPGIKFPKRRTEDGQRISLLPAEEQNRWHSETDVPAGQAESQPAQKSSTSQRAPQEQQPRKSPWYKGREQGTKLSQSRVLSDSEMEMIELGGAS